MSPEPATARSPTSTGVPGLDDVLRGGFPRDRFYLIQGDPGVGKTTLALQFLLAGAKAGETCLYVTLSETAEELRSVAKSHGWSLDTLSLFELPISDPTKEEENTLFHPAEVELNETIHTLLAQIEKVKPSRVVFDSLSEIRLLSQSALRYRRQVLALKQFFVGRGCTVLLLDDQTSEPGDLQLRSVAHGVILLEQLAPLYGADRRRMRILKLRGVQVRGGFHDFTVTRGGMKVFPRLVAAEHRTEFPKSRLTCGLEGLDRLVGGGLDRGTSTLFIGPVGSGKSTVANQYVKAAAAAGERSAIFAFDESEHALLTRSSALGQDLKGEIDKQMIEFRQIDPAELAPGEFAMAVRQSVEERNVRVILIDSLSGYLHAMPQEHFLSLQLHELLTYLGQMGVVTLMVMAQHGLIGATMESPVDVSYLADAVMLFRHFEIDGRLSKAISVLKKRTGNHEKTIRELQIVPGGVSVGPPLEGYHGIMTGVPSRQEPKSPPE